MGQALVGTPFTVACAVPLDPGDHRADPRPGGLQGDGGRHDG